MMEEIYPIIKMYTAMLHTIKEDIESPDLEVSRATYDWLMSTENRPFKKAYIRLYGETSIAWRA